MNMAYAQPLIESERCGHPSNARRFSSRVCNDIYIMMQMMMFRTRDKILRCVFFFPPFGHTPRLRREISRSIYLLLPSFWQIWCRSLFSLWAQRRCFSCYSWWEIWSAFKVRCLVGCSTRWVAAGRNFVNRNMRWNTKSCDEIWDSILFHLDLTPPSKSFQMKVWPRIPKPENV